MQDSFAERVDLAFLENKPKKAALWFTQNSFWYFNQHGNKKQNILRGLLLIEKCRLLNDSHSPLSHLFGPLAKNWKVTGKMASDEKRLKVELDLTM